MLRAIAWVAALVLALGGCAARLPAYPASMSDDEALRVVAERLGSVRTFAGTAGLTLASSGGEVIRLEGALVAEPPHRARLRAWKFGAAVLDLTVLPEGVWLFVAEEDDPPAQEGAVQGLKRSAAGIGGALALLSGDYYRAARPVPAESSASTLVVTAPALGQPAVRCEIERATLVPRRFRVPGEGSWGELRLDGHRMIGDVPWPGVITFRGPEGEVTVTLGSPELNGEIAPGAFNPPARAQRLP
ncbi:MAG: hypothetical protein WD749_07510 [Phycisphaerales bacterium]